MDEKLEKEMDILWGAKITSLMHGYTVAIQDNKEAEKVLDFLSDILDYDFKGSEVMKKIQKEARSAEVQHMSVSREIDLLGEPRIMIVLTLIADFDYDEDYDDYVYDIFDTNGVISYIYDVTAPEFCQFMYTYYEKQGDKIISAWNK